MKIVSRFMPALAGLFVMSTTVHAQFADSVLSYESGTGFAAGFTNGSAALGAPALGSSVTPYAPPFAKTQLVSIGAGGEITLQMDSPILNTPANPYGVDFIIFANSFFVVNGGSGQSATTSGSVFFHQNSALVQVSQDGANWYTLNPALAPVPGEWFPTYGGGNPVQPMDPSLMNPADFAGLTLAQVESLYNGSAGGTGYSLAWAQDAGGNNVDLASADYVRIEVQSGVLDMDAVSVVPEPATWAMVFMGAGLLYLRSKKLRLMNAIQSDAAAQQRSPTTINQKVPRTAQHATPAILAFLLCLLAASSVRAVTFTENFTNNPAQNGWQSFGDASLFQWDSVNDVMDVTWDSSQTNSYFYHPLGTTLSIADSFTVNFDIQLNDITYDSYPFYPMNVAVGLFNYNEATNSGFSRPDGTTPDLFEFDYFPDNGLGEPNLSALLADMTVTATNESDFYFIFDILPMEAGTTYHVSLTHAAGAADLSAIVYTNGQVYSTMPTGFTAPIEDFHLDTLSINSYQEDATYPDNLLAHGTVGNFTVTLPPVVRNLAGTFSNGVWQAQFGTYTGWNYTLDRSTNLMAWRNITAAVSGTGDIMTLSDTSPPSGKAFYRVRALAP
jgi:hypothetical protein